MAYFEVKNLTFHYGNTAKPTLIDLSFSIDKGQFVLVCGASGSGKSTILKMLKPQLAPAGEKTGAIFFEGQNIVELPEKYSASKIGYVMQNPESQIVTDRVWHELAFGLENMGLSSTEIKNRIAEMTNFLGIQELVDKQTSDLSGGQKQLLNLASVLVMRPDVLILDEPTTQLDPIASQNFIDILVRLNKETGLTIILAEHYLESVFPLANKVLVLDKGAIIFSAEPQQVVEKINTATAELARFTIGLPSATRIYHGINGQGKCPLTVVEGKYFLSQQFSVSQVQIGTPAKIEHNSKQKVSLKLTNCWFRYEKSSPDVLAGVNLELKEGEVFTLVGGNGTGKTTLLKAIAGILTRYKGKMTVLNKPSKKNQQVIGYLPQEPQMIFVKDSVMEDYTCYLEGKDMNQQEQLQRIKEVAVLLDIEAILEQHPFDLSGGQCQRAALGKLLLTDPKILLLDEPTKGIDAYGKKQLITLLKELSKQKKTILVVTHDLDFAAELSDRCGLFFQSNLLTTEKPEVFFSNQAFYTTAASRISREIFSGLVTTERVIDVCQKELRRSDK